MIGAAMQRPCYHRGLALTYAPATIRTLRAYLQSITGLSDAALGIVGDAAHARRSSYHNGRDRIVANGALATDYTCRTLRDRAGLTDAASALDIGSFPRLRAMSVWLVNQARANAAGTQDIREIIYTDDGRRVLRYDRERGFASLPRTGEADDSHLWHTHISWYRDSERRDKLSLFRRYFSPQEDDDVRQFGVYEKRAYVTVIKGGKLYTNSDCIADGNEIIVDPAREFVYVGTMTDAVRIIAYEGNTSDTNASSTAKFIRKTHLRRDAQGNVIIRFVEDAASPTFLEQIKRDAHNAAIAAGKTALSALIKE